MAENPETPKCCFNTTFYPKYMWNGSKTIAIRIINHTDERMTELFDMVTLENEY